MSEPDVPTPGGFKDTVNRLKADFQSGKDAAAAYMSGSTPQSEAAAPSSQQHVVGLGQLTQGGAQRTRIAIQPVRRDSASTVTLSP